MYKSVKTDCPFLYNTLVKNKVERVNLHNISVLHDSVASLLAGLYSLYKTESEPIKGTLQAVAALVEYMFSLIFKLKRRRAFVNEKEQRTNVVARYLPEAWQKPPPAQAEGGLLAWKPKGPRLARKVLAALVCGKIVLRAKRRGHRRFYVADSWGESLAIIKTAVGLSGDAGEFSLVGHSATGIRTPV